MLPRHKSALRVRLRALTAALRLGNAEDVRIHRQAIVRLVERNPLCRSDLGQISSVASSGQDCPSIVAAQIEHVLNDQYTLQGEC